MKKCLLLMDMTSEWTTNGVSRFINELTHGMSHNYKYHLIWLHFIQQWGSESMTICNVHEENILHIYVTLPSNLKEFLGSRAHRNKIWNKTFAVLKTELFKYKKLIIHVHTLNLMEFALYMREFVSCKIVSHVHCIPWKGLYNRNIQRFNQLYYKYYIEKDYSNPSDYILHDYEWAAYSRADSVICVTKCGCDFIHNTCKEKYSKVHLITNGIKDMGLPHNYNIQGTKVNFLFVGNSSASKGLFQVLKGLNIVSRKYDIYLKVVGTYSSSNQEYYHSKFPFLNLHFTGKLDMLQLRSYYQKADIGLIGSLQEQCSYVAIEMMMFGLPIISTSIDGLGELLVDRLNARLIPSHFHPQDGLNIDTLAMSNAIISLVDDINLRSRIGMNARHRYLSKHSLQTMVKNIEHIYETL